MTDGLHIGDVSGGIRGSKLAGRDIVEVSINIIEFAGIETPSGRNLHALLRRLKEALPRLDESRRADTLAAIAQVERAIADLPGQEREYLKRVVGKLDEEAPYYVPLSAETTESRQSESSLHRTTRRRQRRAMADYCEWVPAQREIQRVRLDDLQEGVEKYPCITLLGDPGSGKTTAIEMLALRLAHKGLKSDPGRPGLLPLSLRLSEFEAGMEVEDFIVQGWSGSLQGNHWGAGELAANLEGYLDQGRLFLLLDALNEMPREQYNDRVGRLRQFIDRWQVNGNRFLVSCRVLDYGEELQGLQRIEILPLNDNQVQHFVMSEITAGDRTCEVLWSLLLEAGSDEESARVWGYLATELERSGLSKHWETITQALVPGDESKRGLLEMARNPYLLTVIIDVLLDEDRDQGRPDPGRAQLMANFATIQMNWARNKVNSREWLDNDVQEESLSVLAFEMQRRASFGTLVKTEHVKAVMPETVQPDPQWPPVPAPPDRVLVLAASANIIEMPPDRSSVRFYHQLLQEYFAARSMLRHDLSSLHELWRWPWRREEMPQVGQRGEFDPLPPPPPTGWEETTVLTAEIASGRHGELMRHLIDANPVLAGRCLHEARMNVEDTTRDAVTGALLATIAQPGISLRVRISAGDVLGYLGDPRLGELVTVPAGAFLMGSELHGPPHEVSLPEYRIAKFPVTHAEYARFLESGGYEDRRWWTEAGWKWKGNTTEPEYWDDQWFSKPNYPVVGVSWYEAAAYCRWQSAELGQEVRLPTEAEWEKAARGHDGRQFPWAGGFDVDNLNIRLGEEPVNRTTPVGIYSAGSSPYGVLDCAGQVWEWCSTPTTSDYRLRPYGEGWSAHEGQGADAEAALGRIVRGASWTDRQEEVAACAYREWFYPDFRSFDRGFRVVIP